MAQGLPVKAKSRSDFFAQAQPKPGFRIGTALHVGPQGIELLDKSFHVAPLAKDIERDLKKVRKIGGGQQGEVLLVVDNEQNPFALKMIDYRSTNRQQMLQQVTTEVRPFAHSSDYAVKLYNVYASNHIYLLMEYLDNGSLASLQNNLYDRKLAPHLCAYVAHQLLHGLQDLHRPVRQVDESSDKLHGMIHRDVKPDNIMLHGDGKVKLADFGVSTAGRSIQHQTLIGTQGYMSPERIVESNYSYSCDVWSVGIVIAELLTGVHPLCPDPKYKGPIHQLVMKFEGVKLPTEDASEQDFINSCLMKTPDQRPSATTLLQHPWIVKYCGEGEKTAQVMELRTQFGNLIRALGSQGTEGSNPVITGPLPTGLMTLGLDANSRSVSAIPQGASTPNYSMASTSSMPQSTSSFAQNDEAA